MAAEVKKYTVNAAATVTTVTTGEFPKGTVDTQFAPAATSGPISILFADSTLQRNAVNSSDMPRRPSVQLEASDDAGTTWYRLGVEASAAATPLELWHFTGRRYRCTTNYLDNEKANLTGVAEMLLTVGS